jgi:urease beta subunit
MDNSSQSDWHPGQIWVRDEDHVGLTSRTCYKIMVTNTGDRPVQIGSHFHFFEVNKALKFDRRKAYGMRLNIAASTAVRFEPGQYQEVEIIAFGGERVCHGFNGLVEGELDSPNIREASFSRAKALGFIDDAFFPVTHAKDQESK